MQPRSGFMSGLHVIADWIMRLSIVNLFWLMINLPVAGLIFFILISPNASAMVVLAIPLFFLVSLLFFPSTIAVFALVRDWVVGNEVASISKAYWGHLKETYRQSLVIGLILSVAWLIWGADLYYFNNHHELLAVVFVFIGFLLLVYTMNVLSVHVHFNVKRTQQFKNAFLVTFGNPVLTILILAVTVIIAYLSIRFWFIGVFFAMSANAIVCFFLFYRYTKKLKEKIS